MPAPRVEEILALKDLDAVIVASTPNVHYAQAKAALERGLHVLDRKTDDLYGRRSARAGRIGGAKKTAIAHQLPVAFYRAWH